MISRENFRSTGKAFGGRAGWEQLLGFWGWVMRTRFGHWACRMGRGFNRVVGWGMPMVRVGTGLLLLGFVVYWMHARYQIRPWYDETCMLEPAIYMARGEAPQSHIWPETIGLPAYGMNYPLFMIVCAGVIRAWGVNFWVIRSFCFLLVAGSCLLAAWGLIRKGVFRFWPDALYFLFIFLLSPDVMWNGIQARPECLTMPIVLLLMFGLWTRGVWASIGCFVLSFLIPWCGFQWIFLVGLLIGAVWLFFGMEWKKLLVAGGGLGAGLLACLLFYYFTHTWASYCQEAARVGGLSIFPSALRKIRVLNDGDISWLFQRWRWPPTFMGGWWGLFLLGIFSKRLMLRGGTRRALIFALAYSFCGIVGLALLANISKFYYFIFSFPVVLAYILVMRDIAERQSWLVVLLLVVFTVYWGYARVLEVRYHTDPWRRWLHHPEEMEQVMARHLRVEDVVVSTDEAYYAVRRHAGDWYPLCLAFDTNDIPVAKITKLVLPNHAIRIEGRMKRWSPVLNEHFGTNMPVTVEPIVALLGERWGCEFREVGCPEMEGLGPAGYRLFERVGGGGGGGEA